MTFKGYPSHQKCHDSIERVLISYYRSTVIIAHSATLASFPTYWSKNAKFIYSPVFNAPVGDDPVGISLRYTPKTRMMRLTNAEESK